MAFWSNLLPKKRRKTKWIDVELLCWTFFNWRFDLNFGRWIGNTCSTTWFDRRIIARRKIIYIIFLVWRLNPSLSIKWSWIPRIVKTRALFSPYSISFNDLLLFFDFWFFLIIFCLQSTKKIAFVLRRNNNNTFKLHFSAIYLFRWISMMSV